MRLAAVLFTDFETLDLYGPLQMLGNAPDLFEVVTVGRTAGTHHSAQGQGVIAEYGFDDCPPFDAMLVPGGRGTRTLVDDAAYIGWLATRSRSCQLTMSVCTGAALLARAGVLDEHRATTNKLVFEWVRSQGPRVEWVEEARWVDDGRVVTAAGVSAGIDMALAVVSRFSSPERARQLAQLAEYEWHESPDWDPFARLAGLA